MSDPSEPIRAIELQANGFTFTGIAAGPSSGDLVLLLHGWPQFADSWTPILRDLGADGYRAVAVDQRGYSRGARPEEISDYAIDALVSDVIGFADALGAHRFHLVTHDWGGLVGWHVAVKHADRVHTFTSLATPHPQPLGHAKEHDPDQKKRSAYVDMFRLPGNVAEKALMSNDAAALRAAYEGTVSPEQIEENVRRFREPGALTATLNWYRANEFASELGSVTVPTLYVWASRDRALGPLAAHQTAQFVSGPYRFETLDATHWIPDEMPRETVALIRSHLAEYGTHVHSAGSQ